MTKKQLSEGWKFWPIFSLGMYQMCIERCLYTSYCAADISVEEHNRPIDWTYGFNWAINIGLGHHLICSLSSQCGEFCVCNSSGPAWPLTMVPQLKSSASLDMIHRSTGLTCGFDWAISIAQMCIVCICVCVCLAVCDYLSGSVKSGPIQINTQTHRCISYCNACIHNIFAI